MSLSNRKVDLLVVGGGAAGFFCAINAKLKAPNLNVLIIERANKLLHKVRISGGGRCNVTNGCFDPRELVKNYPRGEKELRGPFNQFACGDTMDWFESRGVELKIEPDDRVFPVSNNSESIAKTLLDACADLNIKIETKHGLVDFQSIENGYQVKTATSLIKTQYLFLATGSTPAIWKMLAQKHIPIVAPVPSLFTFNIKDPLLKDLPGVSMPEATVKIPSLNAEQTGPVLITHWGLSGPGILKLSSKGARELYNCKYQFQLSINWVTNSFESVLEALKSLKVSHAKRLVYKTAQFDVPNRLWQRMLQINQIAEKLNWADLSKKSISRLAQQLVNTELQVNGKSTFKDEFVTAGGVDLKAINFKQFEFKDSPNLFAAGEVLNIDALTGGFNFQAAWTGAYIAANTIADRFQNQ